ncbi:hypothetical protein R1flu_026991 [Riccia fluitans]|uniref:Uncharacterized protein n=1 Tax=Riccia fluitans TaxID=41844 RepID=A0ABD1XI85_9MARC
MPEVPPPPPKKARPGPSQTQEEKTTRLVENAEMRHAWFVWFVLLVNLDKCRRLYWTPGTDQGRECLVDKLIELAMEAFTKASVDLERFGFGRSLEEIQERLTKSVKSIPRHLLKQYELWLKSPQFESWTLEKERYPWSLPMRLRTEEDVRQVYRNQAKTWDEWFRRPPQLRNPGSLSWRYKNCEPIFDNMFVLLVLAMAYRGTCFLWVFLTTP